MECKKKIYATITSLANKIANATNNLIFLETNKMKRFCGSVFVPDFTKKQDAQNKGSYFRIILSIVLLLFFVSGSFAQITTTTVNTNPYCIGSTGSVKITASTGTPPYTFQQISPSVGAANVVSTSPYAYTFTGLPAGTYTFKITDAASQTTNRVVTLTNPGASFYGANSGQRGTVAVCDSIDWLQGMNITNGRPFYNGYKMEIWFNSNTATGSPSQTIYAGNSATLRLPLANAGSVHTLKLTDSCGNGYTQNITTNALGFYAAATQVCGQTLMGINYRGLKVPISFSIYNGSTTTGSPVQTSTVSTDTYGSLYYMWNYGGTMVNLPAGTYTLVATDACGKTLSTTANYTPASKSVSNTLACNVGYADQTTGIKVNPSNLTTPFTISVLSGPTTYTGTASSDVMDNTINTYPVTLNVSTVAANSNFSFANVPAGTYKIAVNDACGFADTSFITINPSDVISRSLSTTLVAGCLDAHTVTETVTRSSCGIAFNDNLTHLVNASTGAVVAINTQTTSGNSFTSTYNNVPSGTYYLRYATNFTSILSRNGNNSSYIYYQDTIQVLYTQPSVSGILVAPCPNSTMGSLIATIKDGSAPFTYEVLDSFPNNIVLRAGQSSNIFSGLPLNSKYRIRATDNCGNNVVSANISFAGVKTNVAASTDISCAATGSTVTLTADSLNATTYAWSGPNGFSATGRIVSIPSFATTNAGTYKVVSTTVGNCLDSATVVVNQKPNAGNDQTICQNTTTILTATLVTSGSWSARSGNPSTATITTPTNATTTVTGLTVAGTYNFIWTAYTGCTDTIAVTVNALPTVAAITGTNIVTIGSISTLANTTSGGVWSSLNTNIATISGTGLVTGVVAGAATINYKVTNANSCTNTAAYTITVNPRPYP